MKHKKLILTILMTLCMTIVAGFGVYATIASSLSISGTLNFVALTKEVYVNEIKLSNYVDADFNIQTSTLQNFNGKYLKENASVSLGTGINVIQGETLEIAITMTNLTSSYLRANLSYSNLGTVSITTTGLIMPINSGNRVETGQAKIMKIYIKNTTAQTVNLSNLSLTISFTDLGTSLLQDSGSYYYVEMGTYKTQTKAEYFKWRLVSTDLSSRYSYSSTVPTSNGYFVLETDTSGIKREDNTRVGECVFNSDCGYYASGDSYHILNGWTEVPTNDYATSTIREYLNATNVYTGVVINENVSPYNMLSYPDENSIYTNILKDFNIDGGNDIIYNKIQSRALSDLYSNSSYNSTDLTYPESLYNGTQGVKQVIPTEKDKFWLPSYKEGVEILGGGQEAQNELNWGNENYFWSRTPWDDNNNIIGVFPDYTASNDNDLWGGIYEPLVRPMFLLSF